MKGGSENRFNHFDVEYRSLAEAKFLELVLEQELRVVRSAQWMTDASLGEVGGEMLFEASFIVNPRTESVMRLGDAIVQLEKNELSLRARVAAATHEGVEQAMQELATMLPAEKSHDDEVPIQLWWWNGHVAQEDGSRITVPSWHEVEGNYAEPTRAAVEELVGWTAPPTSGGRLLLWHGPPGSGKTSAIRALAREWRSWAEFHFIADPESFLSNTGYLLEVVSDGSSGTSADLPWRILVLEDAGEYLSPDAKALAGQGLSRLLNLCDGVLGQATRSVVLVTTNEPIGALHPAVSRPGRCLAEIEFEELGQAEIAAWCAARQVPPLGRRKASIADLFAYAEGRDPGKQRSSVGFGRAA